MNTKGMLSLPLAFEVEREIYDFLNVSFEIKATKSGEALKKYYTETSPLVKGPFIKISLPYEASKSSEESPLQLKMKFAPYKHQINAFKRLHFRNAQNAIVTTGTGSGKTECFLYPILDYVENLKKNGEGNKGIKAIILYPMNALLDDQALRFMKTIKEHGLDSLDMSVGKYTGGNGQSRSMNYRDNKVIDHRDTLVRNPPDILLTNYKMLDYMLFRDQEKPLWNEQTKKYLKYLVLDEMHTFDGAQGSDVACLIRRLKAVSEAEDQLVFIGTSATLSSSPNAKKDLCEFASSLFGSEFKEESIVVETKHTVKTYLGEGRLGIESIPKIFQQNLKTLEYNYGESIEDYVLKILSAFGKQDLLHRPTQIGTFLKDYIFFNKLIEIASKKVLSFDELCSKCIESMPEYSQLQVDGLKQLVKSFITLASYARHEKNDGFPFLTIKNSLWASELKHTLSKVVPLQEEWEFVEETDVLNSHELYLPAVYCSNCGESGWATHYTENSSVSIKTIISKAHAIRSYNAQGKGCILFPTDEKITDSEELNFLYRNQRKLITKNDGALDEEEPIPVIHVPVSDGRCPACDSKIQVRFFSLGSSSLSTVVANSCFSHPLNQDRKIISFSDSVQDASHQASFLNNRSFSFSFKKFLATKLEPNLSLRSIQKNILKLESLKKLQSYEKLDTIGKFAPDKLRKKWLLNGFLDERTPNDLVLKSLCEVVEYNTFAEFTFSSRFGWSMEKVGHGGFYPNHSKWNDVLKKPRSMWIEKDLALSCFHDDKVFEQFLFGFLQRLKVSGCVYISQLDKYYADPKAEYYPAYKKHPDLPLMGKLSKPKFFTPILELHIKRDQNYETLGSKNSWYWRWLNKFCSTYKVSQFYESLSEWLLQENILLDVRSIVEGSERLPNARYVINPDFLTFHSKLKHLECEKCKTKITAPSEALTFQENSHCSQRFCSGKFHLRKTQYSSTYFERYFSQESLRINASEHTGSFDPELKEQVEKEFKQSETLTPNYDTNYLSCTPTMEMGIDIGDLSTVVLKSVPRNAASYFQRIGRSGRTSGNSLDFLIIDKKPHNLYFWMQPDELLNWEVITPACRYKTGHILQRQYNAYVMDQFLHFSKDMNVTLPSSFQWLSDVNDKANSYWKDLFNYELTRREHLFSKFKQHFQLDSESVTQELNQFITSNGLRLSFEQLFTKIKDELSELDQILLNYKFEIAKINPSNEKFYEQIENSFSEKNVEALDILLEPFDELTKKVINDLIGSIISARKRKSNLLNPRTNYLLSKLSDHGILPGYAFPEEGCELEFNIRKPLAKGTVGKETFYSLSVVRSPETALTELAPYNHFYTHGFEAIVDRLGIYGKKEPFKKIGACGDCGNITASNLCEVCNIPVQLEHSFDFKRAKATSAFERSYVTDSKEIREKENYDIIKSFLFDAPIKTTNRKIITFYNEESQFGYEFQTNIDIFTLNRGIQTSADKTNAFSVCKGCGSVAKQQKFGGIDNTSVIHYRSCSAQKEDLVKVSLHRKISSDAVRLPILNDHMIPVMKTILKRAIELHLKGDTGHLQIADYSQAGYEANTFVVIYDNVPGGTGHLRDLFGISLDQDSDKTSPSKFLKMFKDVLNHINSCKCEDGCYHCVWSAENIREKEKVTKKGTIFHLQRLISQSESDFVKKDSGLMSLIKEHSFDGQTEAMLFHALNTLGPKIPFKDSQFKLENVELNSNSSLWKVLFDDDKFCYLKSSPEEYVELKAGGTKPDFHVLDSKLKPVAYIYTDGSRFHLNPGADVCTFEQDIILRQSLAKEYNIPVLTFTYKELDEVNNLITGDDDKIRIKDSYQIQPSLFENESYTSSHLKSTTRPVLALNLLLRTLKIAAKKEGELEETELGNSYLRWACEFNSECLKFDPSSRSFIIDTNVSNRSDLNSFTKIYNVPEEYYRNWISFWQIFNTASLSPILRKSFAFKSIS